MSILLPRSQLQSGATYLGERLGPLWASQYYECRLHHEAEQVDYLCSLSRTGAARLLSDPWLADEPRWPPLQRLLGAWLGHDSLIAQRVPFVWLEFDDIARPPDASWFPSVSLCLVPRYRVQEALSPCHPERQLNTALEATGLLGAGSAELDLLRECFEHMPKTARWIHLSVMLGRTPSAVKVYGVFPRGSLHGYLQSVGWAGDLDSITSLLHSVYAESLVGDQLYVDLNLADLRDPSRCSLGLAVSQQHLVHGPNPDPTRGEILERWKAEGLCCPQKADAARAWLGSDQRFLDLKLVWRQGELVAKAYLGSHRKSPRPQA